MRNKGGVMIRYSPVVDSSGNFCKCIPSVSGKYYLASEVDVEIARLREKCNLLKTRLESFYD